MVGMIDRVKDRDPVYVIRQGRKISVTKDYDKAIYRLLQAESKTGILKNYVIRIGRKG